MCWAAAVEAAAAMLETAVLDSSSELLSLFSPPKLLRKCMHMNSQQLKGRML